MKAWSREVQTVAQRLRCVGRYSFSVAQNCEGSAFGAVILPLLILAAIAATFTDGTRTDLMVARTAEAEVQSRLAAEAGIATALLKLLAPDGEEPWAADGSIYKTGFAGLEVEVSVQNEQAKINLNQVPNQPLERLLVLSCVEKSVARRLTDRIADYVDEDDIGREGGGEGEVYAEAGLGDGPANRRFETVGELLRVPGFTPGLLARMRPFVTAYGYHDTPELGLASARTVMSVLDIDEKAAGAVRARTGRAPDGAAIGVFTLNARVTSKLRPPAASQAVIYVTGDRAAPLRILDWRRAAEPEPVALGCAANDAEER